MMIKLCRPVGLIILAFLIQLILVKPIHAQCDEHLVDKAIENSGNDALFIREFKIKQSENERKKKNKGLRIELFEDIYIPLKTTNYPQMVTITAINPYQQDNFIKQSF